MGLCDTVIREYLMRCTSTLDTVKVSIFSDKIYHYKWMATFLDADWSVYRSNYTKIHNMISADIMKHLLT